MPSQFIAPVSPHTAPSDGSPYQQLQVPPAPNGVLPSVRSTFEPARELSIASDPQAYATSTDSGYQALHDTLKRPAGARIGSQTLAVIDDGRSCERLFSVDKEGKLFKHLGEQKTECTDITLQYVDALGIVRDDKGAEVGKLAIPASWQKTLAASAGVFLHSDQAEALLFFRKTAQGYTAPVAYLDRSMQLASGEKILFRIGTPPQAEMGYQRQRADARITSIARDKDGKGLDYQQTPLLQHEVGHLGTGTSDRDAAKLERVAKLLERDSSQMRTVREKRDAQGKVIQEYSLNIQELAHRDSIEGPLQKHYVGMNSDGSLLMYVGAGGTREEQKNGGWRDLKKAGYQHLFLGSDFSLHDEHGTKLGTVDVRSLDEKALTYQKNGRTREGVFLTQDVRVVMTSGEIQTFSAKDFSLGDSKALIQLGSPPENTPIQPPFDSQRYFEDMEIAEAGGFVPGPNKLIAESANVVHFLSDDGSMRVTIDYRSLDEEAHMTRRARMQEIDQQLEALSRNTTALDAIQALGGGLGARLDFADRIEALKEERRLLVEETADMFNNLAVKIERRVHMLGNHVDAFSGRSSAHGIWAEDPRFRISYPEFRARWPQLFGKAPVGTEASPQI